MMQSAAIRQAFLDFFSSKGHLIVPSAPIVVKNDPTLLFTNAGMNQFKDYFLGNSKAPSARIADTQKCLRVSGKHNDLEEVGVDTYHHTMFEMLGNWSFGDPDNSTAGYFKPEAIEWSWELLTGIFKIPKERLYVTVFKGDDNENLPKDEEAFNEWMKWVPEERILLGNKKDNFWEMGDTGPCGPCTEIHVDCRSEADRNKIPGHDLVNNDHPQVIEIWNNVFIQFNRKKDGSLEPLPAKHVDTGMGFERLVRVLQNKESNYDTDVFMPTIKATETLVNKKYTGDDSKTAIAFRVLADHIRAIGFAIADGQLPSNTGAGYVIRRILRRAVRYYYSSLEYKRPLLFQLLPVVANQFSDVFPELKQQQDFVLKVIREEEESFLHTLEKGLKKIEDIMASTGKGQPISGTAVFELYDTFGFPLDLTKLIAQEQGLTIDEKGFEVEMQQQKNRSRAATTIDTEDWIVTGKQNSGRFIGYTQLEAHTKLIKYRKIKSKGKKQFQFVLEDTPFYAESGGQVGDTGVLIFGEEAITITDTRKEDGMIIHFADVQPVDVYADVKAVVDAARRRTIEYNHSATHLLHAALRETLGNHVAQKGSLVAPGVLRFDFSHFTKVTNEELIKISHRVNEKIRENIPVVIKEMPRDEAMKLGAMALFGEKYGDTVRVVTIDPNYSIELCGGTHVGFTGSIGLFTIAAETAVAAGVRRIEALTGEAALHYLEEKTFVFDQLKDELKTNDIKKAVAKLQEERTILEKRIESLEARQLVGIRNSLLEKDEIINNITFVGEMVEVPHLDSLKKLVFDLKNNLHDYVVVLCANIGGKAHVCIGISDTVVKAKNLDAGKMIKEIVSPLISGGGGGQKNLATAGGKNPAGFIAVINAIREEVKSR